MDFPTGRCCLKCCNTLREGQGRWPMYNADIMFLVFKDIFKISFSDEDTEKYRNKMNCLCFLKRTYSVLCLVSSIKMFKSQLEWKKNFYEQNKWMFFSFETFLNKHKFQQTVEDFWPVCLFIYLFIYLFILNQGHECVWLWKKWPKNVLIHRPTH